MYLLEIVESIPTRGWRERQNF